MGKVNRSLGFLLIIAFVASSTNMGLLAVARAQPTAAAEYRVGPGDRIFLSVPQRADLSRQLIVKADGYVSLPLIGDVGINGLTAAEIEVKLLQALRDYYPSISRVQVTITEAISQVIYVSGQVRTPGKFTFAQPPNVWEAIREAGGPLPQASLDNVRIVKDRARGGNSIMVNVLAAIEGGSIDTLPELEAGDTIIIPSQDEVYTGTFGVNISGAVLRPGVYRLQARQDLMSAILVAGGPMELAELKEVRIIRPRSDGTIATMQVNLEDFLSRGDPFANPKLIPGDTVHIPRKSRLVQLFDTDIRTMLNLSTAMVSLAVLVITLQDRKNK